MVTTCSYHQLKKVLSKPFWKEKTLEEMTELEWESLCDGCARCCLIKLEDEMTNQVHYTGVVCRYLDDEACQCTRYNDRTKIVPDCVELKPVAVSNYTWLPDTCAYRLVAEGKSLLPWHHLISGSRETVHEAGISVRGKCLSEENVHPDSLEEQVIYWVGQSSGDDA